MRVMIIVPTYNEKENIQKLIQKIQIEKKKIKKWQIEILIIDDNSPDGTGKIVNLISKRNKSVHLLERKNKVGLGAAYLAGMEEAFLKYKSDVVISMDADLSHKPEYLKDFLRQIEEGMDLVIGSRYMKGGSIPKEWAVHRKIYSILGNKVASLILGTDKINDWTSGYRAIRKSVFLKVKPKVKGKITRGYTFNMSFAYHTLLQNFRVSHVPIRFPDRKAGKSKLGLEYLIYTPIFLIKTRLGRLKSVS